MSAGWEGGRKIKKKRCRDESARDQLRAENEELEEREREIDIYTYILLRAAAGTK